jgi:hypothetical protein
LPKTVRRVIPGPTQIEREFVQLLQSRR